MLATNEKHVTQRTFRIVTLILTLLLLSVGFAPHAWAVGDEEVGSETVTFEQIAGLDELTKDHAQVFRLYWAIFDREPDAGGALYWLDRWDHCVTLPQIARLFLESTEFEATYGELNDSDFIDLVYRNVLDREAESEGKLYWLSQLSNHLDRIGIMLNFADSLEFRNAHALPSDGVPGRGCRTAVEPTGPRALDFQNYEPFATVGGVSIHLPSVAVEQVGFHQSSHDGSRQMTLLTSPELAASGPPIMTMESRNRGTGSRTAADIVVHPGFEIRSPVTGTVVRSGGYILYCKYRDDFLVIEPDEHPGWEVKIFHIDGVQVRAGDRVEAGVTVIAPTQTLFPFRSQIDEFTGEPSWGHVHVEVVDPTIPDRPSGRPCP